MEREPREFTLRAVATGFAIGLVLTAAVTYLALYSGLAISAAVPGALLSTGLLRARANGGTILENNIAQTIASAGEALAVGMVFTIPALVIAGLRPALGYWEVSAAAVLGGVLGVLFMIPLRRPLVVESTELRYPESVACAKIAEAGDTGAESLLPALLAMLGGIVFRGLVSVVQVMSGTVEAAFRLAGAVWYVGTDVSLALIGLGVIVKLHAATLLVLGGAITWVVVIPFLAEAPAGAGSDLVQAAWEAWRARARYIGVGAMVVGGLWSIIQARQAIARGVAGAFASLRAGGKPVDRTDADLPMAGIATAILLTGAGTFVFFLVATGSAGLGLVLAVTTVVLVFFFAAVSSYIVGFVGNSNNPVSGIAICAFLLVSGMLWLVHGAPDVATITGVLLLSSLVCGATATAGDTAQHLRTGFLLGATPWRQQVAQVAGVVALAFVIAPIVIVLERAYGIGVDRRDALKAPQAVIFANLTRASFAPETLPWTMLALGAGIGLGLVLVDLFLRRAGAGFRLHVMPVAVGLYIPVSLSMPILLGGVLGAVLSRATRRYGAEVTERAQDRAALLGSGLITGESLVGVSAAVPMTLGWSLPVRVLDSPALSLAGFGLALGLVFYFSYLRPTGR
jgi:putative OPT family oligopeptide transporter